MNSPEVRFFDPATGEPQRTIEAHDPFVMSLDYAPDEVHFITTGYDGTLKIWDLKSGALLHSHELGAKGMLAVSTAPDNDTVAVSLDHQLLLFSIKEAALKMKIEIKPKGVYQTDFSPDGRWLTLASADTRVRVWDLKVLGLTWRDYDRPVSSIIKFANSTQETLSSSVRQIRALPIRHARRGMMRKILSPAFPILLGILMFLVGCSSGDEGPSERPSFTAPPDDRGSAVLVYELSAEQKSSGLSASSSIGIPINMDIDVDNPKVQARIEGSTLADYYVRVGGTDQGKECFIEFTYLVDYEVKGSYNPDPKCDFDIQVTGTYKPGEIERSGTCSVPFQKMYPAAALFIPPPPGLHKIPGSLPVVPIRDNDGVKITLELKNVVVPASSGCFFGG